MIRIYWVTRDCFFRTSTISSLTQYFYCCYSFAFSELLRIGGVHHGEAVPVVVKDIVYDCDLRVSHLFLVAPDRKCCPHVARWTLTWKIILLRWTGTNRTIASDGCFGTELVERLTFGAEPSDFTHVNQMGEYYRNMPPNTWGPYPPAPLAYHQLPRTYDVFAGNQSSFNYQ